MKRVTVVLLSIILLFVSCNVEPKMCIVTVDDGAGDRTELRIVAGSEFLIEAKTRDGYRIASIQDQNGKAYEVGNKIEITSDISITYSWEIYTSSSDFSWQFYEGQVIAGEYLGTSDVVKVPDKINGKAVTGIGRSAFYGHATMRKVIIPDSVTFIGSDAFYGCQSLEQINLPAEIQYLMNGAFDGCSGIKEINIPSSVVEISANVFNEWTADQTIILNNIPANALKDGWNNQCNANVVRKGDLHNWTYEESPESIVITGYKGSESRLEIPASIKGKPVVKLGPGVFKENRAIAAVVLPDTIEEIGEECFHKCDGINSIILPANLKVIARDAFKYCTKIEIVDTSKAKNLVHIGEGAFYGCYALTDFNIPESVELVGRFAFGKCSIKSFHIPERLCLIDECALNSRNLESITIDERNKAFYVKGNCLISSEDNKIIMATSKAVIPTDSEITTIGNKAFSHTGIVEIDVPENITTIEREAFGYCKELVAINLSKSLISMDGNPAGYCPKLSTINVAAGNLVYHSAGNSVIHTGSQTLVMGCKNTVIPEDASVKNIGSMAFLGSSEMTGITIPSNISTIEFLAFAKCTGINELVIPRTVSNIEKWAFSNWSSRQTIRIEPGTPVHNWDGQWNYESSQNGYNEGKIIAARIEGLN